MEIELSLNSATGVLMASYSNRYSSIWTWDVDSQEILGFQDVKARARLTDDSEDGKHCSWYILDKGQFDIHIGASRPCSFHALLWQRIVAHRVYCWEERDDPRTIRFEKSNILYQRS